MADKRLVASTPQGQLRLLGSGGTFAVRNFQQIRQYLKASLGEDYARFLAEPSFDNANARIDWYAEVAGEPRPLSALDPAAAEAARTKLQERRTRIQGLAEALSKREQQSAILLGELLRQALSVPNDEAVLVAGEEPLLINWGAAADQPRAGSGGTVLSGTLRGAPAKAAPVTPPPAAAVAPVAAVTALPPRRSAAYWLWALPLWLLFAVIMSIIYYELLEACGASGPGPADNDNPFITFCPGQAVADPGPPPELQRERELAASLKQRLRQLEIQTVEARRECTRPGGPPTPATPTPATPTSPTPAPAPAPAQ